MNNEWFEIAWINFTKAILHGQCIDDEGREVQIERVLTDAERERVYTLNEKQQAEMHNLLLELAKAQP